MAGIQNTSLFSQGERLETSTPEDIANMQITASDVARANYSGDPNGNVAANPSSLSHDPTSGDVWIKRQGTGNTGWENIFTEQATPPIGSLAYFANANGDTYVTDAGWLKCDGSIYNDADYPILAARIGKINPPGTTWASGSGAANGQTITYSGTRFVAGVTGGSIQTSTDAVATFSAIQSPFTQTINSIIFEGGIYVAASNTGRIATSTDAFTWTAKAPSLSPSSGTAGAGPCIIYDGSKYVGVNTHSVMTSTDAITWNTVPTCPPAVGYNSVVFANSLYTFGAASGALYTSTDLVTFTLRTTGVTGNNGIGRVIFAGGIYVAATAQTSQGIMTSTDAVTWTLRTTSPSNTVAYNGSNLYVAGFNSGGSASSTDAITWTNRTNLNGVRGLAFGATLWVAVGVSGLLRSSTDGVTWDVRTSGTSSVINQVTFLNSLFVYVGAGGAIGTSADGITWTARTSGVSYDLKTLTYQGGWYAGGDGGMLTSTDAITWTTITPYSGTSTDIIALAYGASTYVYGGVNGIVATSTDAHTWTARTSGTGTSISTLNYGTTFVYGNTTGQIANSTDGITWTTRTSSGISFLKGLKYLNSNYITGGLSGNTSNIITSTDAITWTTRTSGSTSQINSFEYSNGYWNAQGSGVGVQSNDLATWNPVVFSGTANASAQGAGKLVVVQNSANFLYSSDNYPYNSATQFEVPTDAGLLITTESPTNFRRSLYIKATLP